MTTAKKKKKTSASKKINTLRRSQLEYFGKAAAVIAGMSVLPSLTSGAVSFKKGTGGTSTLWLADSGNVGMGTTNPNKKLHVTDDIWTDTSFQVLDRPSDYWLIQPGSGATEYPIGLRFRGVPDIFDVANGYGDVNIIPGTGGTGGTLSTSYLTVKNGGNVGMGTASPNYTLDVAGSINATAKSWFSYGSATSISGYSWTDAAVTTNSIEIVNNNGVVTTSSPTLAFHRYGSGGPQFRLDPTGTNVLYLESSNSNSARNPAAYGGGVNAYFSRLHIDGGLTAVGNVVIGTLASAAIAAPTKIVMDGSHSNGSTKDKCKIYLHNSESYGFGIGAAGDIQHHSDVSHDFYINNVKKAWVNTQGVHGAVWNDIADYLEVENEIAVEFGKVYIREDNGQTRLSKKRCERGVIGIASDTYGMSVGKKGKDKKEIPIALAGIVLAHVDHAYPTGTPLTTAKNGCLTKMPWWEVMIFPYRVVATAYKPEPKETWNGIIVNDRHWVKIQ